MLPLLVALVFSQQAQALSNFSPSDLSAISDATVNSMIQTVSLVIDHRAYMPATAMGYTIGVDIGLDASMIQLPTEFRDALILATGQSGENIPTVVPLPRLNLHKGLPFGIDAGFAYSAVPDTNQSGVNIFTEYAADLKWTFIRKATLPAVAVRASATMGSLYFFNTHSYDIDLLVSKNLVAIDPYIGVGMQIWNGDLAVPVTVADTAVTTLSFHQSGTNYHFYAGMPLKLVFLRLTPQVDYTTAGFYSYGLKISLGF